MTQVKFSSPPTAAPPPGERVSEMRWQPAPPLPSLSTQNKPAPASAPSHAALDDAPVPPPTHFSPSKAAPPPAQSHLIKRKLAISRALSPPPSHLPGPAPLASAASSPSRIPVSRRVAARRRLSEGLRSPAVSEREGEGSSRARGAQVECRSDGAVDRLHADSQRLLHVSTAMHAAGDRTLLVLRESDVAALRESMPWSPVKGVQADAKHRCARSNTRRRAIIASHTHEKTSYQLGAAACLWVGRVVGVVGELRRIFRRLCSEHHRTWLGTWYFWYSCCITATQLLSEIGVQYTAMSMRCN